MNSPRPCSGLQLYRNTRPVDFSSLVVLSFVAPKLRVLVLARNILASLLAHYGCDLYCAYRVMVATEPKRTLLWLMRCLVAMRIQTLSWRVMDGHHCTSLHKTVSTVQHRNTHLITHPPNHLPTHLITLPTNQPTNQPREPNTQHE